MRSGSFRIYPFENRTSFDWAWRILISTIFLIVILARTDNIIITQQCLVCYQQIFFPSTNSKKCYEDNQAILGDNNQMRPNKTTVLRSPTLFLYIFVATERNGKEFRYTIYTTVHHCKTPRDYVQEHICQYVLIFGFTTKLIIFQRIVSQASKTMLMML